MKEHHIYKVPVTGAANAKSDALIVSEQMVTFMNYPSDEEGISCLICDNSGFLDSELLASDQQSESVVIGRLHFICGLYSHQVKLVDLEKRTFEAKANFKQCIQKVDTSADQSQNEAQYCFYCSKPVDIEGWACSEPGCKHSTHLYCALVQRARAKTLSKHLPTQPIQEATASNELKARTLDSDYPDWRIHDHGSQYYGHVTWFEQVEDPRSHWYLPFGTGPQNAQFQEQLRTIRRDVHIEAAMAETLKNSAQLLTDLKIQVTDVESRTHAYASPLVFLERGSKNFFSRTDFNSRSSSPLPADQNRILTASPDSELVPDIEVNRRPSLRPDGVCCPTHFSQSASFYCYCGTKQEINEVEEFESVYCEDCGTWFHQKCVGISSKEHVPEVWQCQKCHDLGHIVSDFPAFLENLVNSIYPYEQGENKDKIQKNSIPYPSLRWRNLLVRDYMILLNLIWKWKDLISPLAVSCLQELMPFTLEGLFGGESAPDNGDQSEVVSHSTVYTEATQVQTLAWLELALSDIVRTKIRNMFSSSFEEDQSNSTINISYLQETRRKLAQLIKNLDTSLKLQLNPGLALIPRPSSTQIKPKSPADPENGTNSLQTQIDQPLLQKQTSDREDPNLKAMASMTLQHTVSLGPDGAVRQPAAWQTPAESMQIDGEPAQPSPKMPYRVIRDTPNSSSLEFGALQKLNTKYLEPFSKLFFSYQKKAGWNIDEVTDFLQKVQASGLMIGSRLEKSLQEVLSRCEELIQQIGHLLQIFMESLHETQLLEVDLQRVQELSLHNSLFATPKFLAEPQIVRTIVFQTGEALSKHYHTTVKKLSDPKDLPTGLKSNLLSAFFDFAQSSKDLQEFIKVIKSMRCWEQSVVDLQRRLEALQTIEIEDLLKTPNWEHRIVKACELEELINLENKEFASLKEKYPFFKRMTEVNLQSKFFPRIEVKTRSNSEVLSVLDAPAAELGRSGIVNELAPEESKPNLDIPSFEAVFQEFIRKGVPLSPECVAAIDRECIRYKTDLFWKGAIKMTSEELGELVASLSKVASGFEDFKRIENLKKLEKIIDIVSDKDYPMNIEESCRIQRLREHSDILNTHTVLGPVKLKIELLLKTVSETEELRHALMRNTKLGPFQPGTESQRRLEQFWTNFVNLDIDEEAVAQVEWENLAFLSKRLLLKNPHLKFFPRLKKFVDKVYLGLALHLSQNFQPSEKAEVKHIVLIQAILDSAKPQTVRITNQLYLKRLEGLNGLLRGVVGLLQSSKGLALQDFRSQVEDLLERRSKMRAIPTHPRSCIRHLTQLLDEADVLGRLLRRVKVFRADDINRKNSKLYRMMAEIVRNNTLSRLPLKQAEVASKDVKEFLRYFKEIEESLQKVEAIRTQASEVHSAVQAKLANRISLSGCLPLIFELPSVEPYEELLKKLEKYPFLEDVQTELRTKLSEAHTVLKHGEDPKLCSRFVDSLGDMRSESLRREFQLYLMYLLTMRLRGLWFASRELKTPLKVLFVCNKISNLAFAALTLKTLQSEYQELQEHPFFDEDVKQKIPYKKYCGIIEERISVAQTLHARLNELWNDPEATLDAWVQCLGILGGSTVAVIDLETLLQNEPAQKQVIELHSKALKIWQTVAPEPTIPYGWKKFFPGTFEGRLFSPESSSMGSEDEVVFVQYGTSSNCWQAISLVLSVLAALYTLQKGNSQSSLANSFPFIGTLINSLDSLSLKVCAWIARLSRTDILLSKLMSPVVQQWLDTLASPHSGFGAFQSSSSSNSPHRRSAGNKLVNTRMFVPKKEKHVEESSTTTRKDKKSNSFSEAGYPGDLAAVIAGKRVDRASSAEHPEDQSNQNRSVGLRGSKSRKSSESITSRFSNSGLGKRKAGSSHRRGGKAARKLPGRANQQVQSKIEEEGSLADPSEDRRGSGHDENAMPGYDNLGSSLGNNTELGASRFLMKKKGRQSHGETGDNTAPNTGLPQGDQDDLRDKISSKKLKGSVFLQPGLISCRGEQYEDTSCELSLFLTSSSKKWLPKLRAHPHSSLHLESREKQELEGLVRRFQEDAKNKSSGFLQGQMSVLNKELKNTLLSQDCWVSEELINGRLWIIRHRLDKKQPNIASLFSDSKGALQSNSLGLIIELKSSQNASLAGLSDQALSGGQQSSPKGGDVGQEHTNNNQQKNQTAAQPTRRQSERKKASKAI